MAELLREEFAMHIAPRETTGIKPKGGRSAQGCATLGLALVLASAAGFQTFAKEMGGASLAELARQGAWVTSQTTAHSGAGHWTWNADGTVCVRLFGEKSDCADTGTWMIDGDTICYEFEWWGETEGMRALCFSVVALGDELYEAKYTGSSGVTSSLFKFRVAMPAVR